MLAEYWREMATISGKADALGKYEVFFGSYEALFQRAFKPFIDRSNLDLRKLVILKNPVIPEGTPALDTSWWMPEKYQAQILSAMGH